MLFYREHCPELNGRTAMVLRLCEDTGRWAVAIGGREASSEQRCIRCFPVNLGAADEATRGDALYKL